jgi:dynein heavy chain
MSFFLFTRPKKNAIFLTELQIDKTGPRYNINFENFELTLCSLFEKAILSTQSIPQLEKYVMEDIFWSGTPLLESVGANEPHVCDLKETIIQMLRQALIPLRAYSKSYERFTNLVNLNVEQYIK